ncbi:hypothetical protein DPMN_091571 [Dreissena polymorpha]|uniref:Uncharacterized protein n=1 Tax=Dreissena polymorpha TaxID=45954 RepID=A0A9D4L0F3_DREPO|nr:hypothetical protein DPMN_091571 [Dreissena polymorpha]
MPPPPSPTPIAMMLILKRGPDPWLKRFTNDRAVLIDGSGMDDINQSYLRNKSPINHSN